jgi:hypothetical protein
METETVFSASHPWFVADGTEKEKPVIFRGRQIPDQFVGDSSLGNVFIVDVEFDVTDSTGLPTQEQYKMIEEFERRCIDAIEARKLGVVAFVKTSNGVTRYFLYVSNVDAASNAMMDLGSANLNLGLTAGDDPDWTEYRAFLRGMRRN